MGVTHLLHSTVKIPKFSRESSSCSTFFFNAKDNSLSLEQSGAVSALMYSFAFSDSKNI